MSLNIFLININDMISNCLAIAVVNDLGIKYINKNASYIIIKEKGVYIAEMGLINN